MLRTVIALLTFGMLAAACATSPRAVPGPPPPAPARRGGDTTSKPDTSTTHDTSAARDTGAVQARLATRGLSMVFR